MTTKHLKHITITCGIVFVLITWFWQTQIQSILQQIPTVQVNKQNLVSNRQSTSRRVVSQSMQIRKQDTLRHFQNSSFYLTIIDNNIFRPLGWRPFVPSPAYRLIGTIMPSEGKTRPQAIIKAIAGNKTHVASIGDSLIADIKIVDIQPKQITLEKAGQRIILKLGTSRWLNAKRSRARQR